MLSWMRRTRTWLPMSRTEALMMPVSYGFPFDEGMNLGCDDVPAGQCRVCEKDSEA